MWRDLVFPELDRYLISNKHDMNTLIEVLEALDYETFKEMQTQWLNRGRMMWYATGNLGKEESIRIVDEATQLLNLESIPKEELAEILVVNLGSQNKHFHRVDITLPDPSNENSVFISYYQYGPKKAEDKDKYSLLNALVMQYLKQPTYQ